MAMGIHIIRGKAAYLQARQLMDGARATARAISHTWDSAASELSIRTVSQVIAKIQDKFPPENRSNEEIAGVIAKLLKCPWVDLPNTLIAIQESSESATNAEVQSAWSKFLRTVKQGIAWSTEAYSDPIIQKLLRSHESFVIPELRDSPSQESIPKALDIERLSFEKLSRKISLAFSALRDFSIGSDITVELGSLQNKLLHRNAFKGAHAATFLAVAFCFTFIESEQEQTKDASDHEWIVEAAKKLGRVVDTLCAIRSDEVRELIQLPELREELEFDLLDRLFKLASKLEEVQARGRLRGVAQHVPLLFKAERIPFLEDLATKPWLLDLRIRVKPNLSPSAFLKFLREDSEKIVPGCAEVQGQYLSRCAEVPGLLPLVSWALHNRSRLLRDENLASVRDRFFNTQQPPGAAHVLAAAHEKYLSCGDDVRATVLTRLIEERLNTEQAAFAIKRLDATTDPSALALETVAASAVRAALLAPPQSVPTPKLAATDCATAVKLPRQDRRSLFLDWVAQQGGSCAAIDDALKKLAPDIQNRVLTWWNDSTMDSKALLAIEELSKAITKWNGKPAFLGILNNRQMFGALMSALEVGGHDLLMQLAPLLDGNGNAFAAVREVLLESH